MARPTKRYNTRMARISVDLDKLLNEMACNLSIDKRRPVTKTDASHILAASYRPPIIIEKGRAKFLMRGSLISL